MYSLERSPVVPEYTDGSDPQLALKVAATYNNPLLVDEIYDFARAYYGSEGGIPGEFRDALNSEQQRLRRATDDHQLIRWLDTPTQYEHAIASDVDRLAARYNRTRQQAEAVASGVGYIALACAPAFNEAWEVGKYMRSIRDHYQGEWPVAGLIIADNNSDDQTARVVRENNGNIVPAIVQGVGPARQLAIDYSLQRRPKNLPLEQTIYVTSDADCILAPGYVGDHVAMYARPENAGKLMANGPIDYYFDFPSTYPDIEIDEKVLSVIEANRIEGTDQIHVHNAADYLAITGGRTVAAYFQELGYDLADFIQGETFHMFGGPNFSFRGSLLHEVPQLYPTHDEWEAHWASINLQTKYPFETYGMTIRSSHSPRAGVTASARALVGPSGYISPTKTVMSVQRLQELQVHGVEPYKVSTGYNTAQKAFPRIIELLHRETYGLYGGKTVDGYYTSYEAATEAIASCTDPAHARHEAPRPALHAGTRLPLGKYVVIGERE